MKAIIFNSITISLPKNIVQFSLGILLYWFMIGVPDAYTTLLALLGFVVAYASVYLYNDAIDYREDKKDREKLKWKLVASGHMNVRSAKIIALVFAVSGLSISLFVSKWFFLVNLGMLFFNFLHTHPSIRLKENLQKTAVNMTIIEFLKFSCGWFALTSDLTKFPFWLIFAFSIVYTTSYLIYKFKFRGKIIKSNKRLFTGLAAAGVFSYVFSFVQYGFPLSMILLIAIPLFIIVLFKWMDIEFHRINNMIIIEYLLLPIVIISFIVLSVPVVGKANESIADMIDKYKEKIADEVPESITEPIDNITNELKKYGTLEDIEEKVKEGLENMSEIIQG
jgi:hypothetical protein